LLSGSEKSAQQAERSGIRERIALSNRLSGNTALVVSLEHNAGWRTLTQGALLPGASGGTFYDALYPKNESVDRGMIPPRGFSGHRHNRQKTTSCRSKLKSETGSSRLPSSEPRSTGSGDWGVVHVLKGYLREYIRVKYVFESLFLVHMCESDMSSLRRTFVPSTVPTEHPSKREAGCPFLG
jgi:hypothetical protein